LEPAPVSRSEGPSLIDYSVTQQSRLSPTLLLMAHSELIPQRELHDSWISRGLNLSKEPVIQPVFGIAEIHLVPGIVEFGAELHAAAAESLRHRKRLYQ